MIGITSYGGYIPRLRMDRMSIYQSMGWFAPATIMVAQGERSFGNWDEDTLTMAVAAARDCLTGIDRSSIDGCYLCTTTAPFADRLNSGVIQTALDLRADIDTRDLTSTLRAGTSGLITALDTVKAGEGGTILVTAADMRQAKTAYFYEMWFGDGAAALTVGSGDDVVAEFLGCHSLSYDFVDHYRGADKTYDYMWEERWVRDEGYSKIIPEVVDGLFAKHDITADDVDWLVFPCFFAAEHRKIAAKLGVAPEKVISNLHAECGETGAAHSLVMLSRALEQAKPGDRILLVGFGQGADALYFRVTDAIEKLPARQGIGGSLERKQTVTNHTKFLKFRDLLKTEAGIRAEAPTQTAMSVLWRKRRMLLGLVGGRCTECGTPQFPRMDICVHPECRKVGTQEDYAFAERPAAVKTFTGDLLAVSVDPPAVYGMVQFEGGGRFMADFSDCTFEDVFVGQRVGMALRRRYVDRERGFSGYFWKAIPDLTAERPKRAAKPAKALDFDGKVAVVTGAGGGLGKIYALELGKRGAKVVVNDLGGAADGAGDGSARPADAVVTEIEAAGGQAVASYDSVSSPEGGQAIIDRAIDAFGRIDILINNAGILRDRSLVKMQPEDWEAVLAVHLDAAYAVTKPAFVRMKEQGFGRIVMTTSAAGLFGNFGQTNYSAAKLGLVGFMNTLKLEGAKYGVRVNTVAPIATTRLTEELLPPNLKQAMQPDHVAPLVLWLCSAECDTNGEVFNAGAGYLSRAAMVSGPGVGLGTVDAPPTVEDIAANWDAIHEIDGATEQHDAMGFLMPLMDVLAGGGPVADDGGGGGDGDDGGGGEIGAAAVFARMPDHFVADAAAGVDVVFQYKLHGDGGGEWYTAIADQTCTVTEGVHERPTTTILMSAPDFVALIKGELNAMAAFSAGKLKIEGDMMKSQLIEKLFVFGEVE
jgi:3-hydroxy-3-methylglutaryl CoA synthase/NAD(P)-dependent dehydrogenase (short-subunit alcohol dehydrogenase family)/putative sterol carrier protein